MLTTFQRKMQNLRVKQEQQIREHPNKNKTVIKFRF